MPKAILIERWFNVKKPESGVGYTRGSRRRPDDDASGTLHAYKRLRQH
jgi:hypothetical protein